MIFTQRHPAVPRFQGSRSAEERVLQCLQVCVLHANFAKFSFQKCSWRPAVTRLRPSLSHSQRSARAASRRCPIHLRSPCNSLRPDSLSAAAAAAITLCGQPHSPRPESLGAVRGQLPRPESLAAACSPSPSTVTSLAAARLWLRRHSRD